MNGKILRKSAAADVKKYFWIFFGAILITEVISLIFSDIAGSGRSIMGILAAVRNGAFSFEQISDVNSDFYLYFTSEPSVFSTLLAMLSFPAMIFLINPLAVGVNKIFLDGIKQEPELKTLISPFKKSYMNTVATMVITTIFLLIITFALAFLYIAVVMIITVPFTLMMSVESMMIPAIILFVVLLLAVMVGYMILTLFVSYNFAFIPYLVAEHDGCRFSQAYETNKRMVYKKKKEIFKTEFIYYFWETVVMLIPFTLIVAGICVPVINSGGILGNPGDILAIGILSLVPAYFIFILIEVYRNALWARMYRVLEVPLYQPPVYQSVNNGGSYMPPVYKNVVSYTTPAEENAQTADATEENDNAVNDEAEQKAEEIQENEAVENEVNKEEI